MNNSTMTKTDCLHELFEKQADIRPHDEAIICNNLSMTYEELDNRSNQLAHYLQKYNVGTGKLVGIFLERSEKHIITILAILKAGAGYVPIDASYPMDRINHIIDDAKISVIISEETIANNINPFYNGSLILLDSQSDSISKQSTQRISRYESGVNPEDLCYVIYTSGTTGRPKGIMTEHRNVTSFLPSFNKICKLDHRDRIYQGFSLGFDGSVEEIWMAFSNGATLIIGTKDVIGFGNETTRLINENKITFFSTVPTFLSMITEELPTVRLIVVSGEQCPPELVTKWATPQRRMLNVYGPTETTVNTTSEECKPDKPITIGKPLSGYTTYILDKHMNPVKKGELGELFIGGTGVARGYLNQKDLTKKHFLVNPFNGGKDSPSTFYRTGDLVRLNDNEELLFLGRIDNQVKVRGFRIELSEIESVLREHSGIARAVVKVIDREGSKDLAAFVVLDNSTDSFDRNEVLSLLQKRLPPYMIPGYLDIITSIPTLTSGKADRNNLPTATIPLIRTNRTIVKPETDLEENIAKIWKKVLTIKEISTRDDFFIDLGGHSLLAAHVVTEIRNTLNISFASIRDIYTYPSVKSLAHYLKAHIEPDIARDNNKKPTKKKLSSKEVFQSLSPFTRSAVVTLQTISLYMFYGLSTMPFVAIYLIYLSIKNNTLSTQTGITIISSMTLGLFPAMLILSIIAKWLIIGRYKPGSYPVWGMYYFRWWLVTRFQMLSGAGFLEGTPLLNLYYRLMGTKVGRNCTFDTSSISMFDVVTIGENTSIGSETSIAGYIIEDGMLIVGSIDIGNNCFIGMHSSIGINTSIGNNANLDDLSSLADNNSIKADSSHRGSPCQPAKVSLPDIINNNDKKRHPVIFGILHFLSIYVIELFLFITAIPSIILFYIAYKADNYVALGLTILLSIPLFELSFCLFLAIFKALILPRTKPGIYSTESFFYLRKWIIDSLFNLSRLLILPLYTTLYLPHWLRMLGAKIGKRAELSIVGITSPDLFVANEESFFADGSIIGGNRYHRGYIEIAQNEIGNRSFIGNNALIPNGVTIGKNNLIGVLSAPPTDTMKTPDNTEWLGSPSFRLPHHHKVEGFSEEETYKPSKTMILHRLMVDTLRIIIPSIIEILGLISLIFSINLICTRTTLPMIFMLTPFIGMLISLGMAILVVIVKNMLMGEYKPIIKPLWSPYVWYNEVVNGAYEAIGAPMLSLMLGTPFFAWYLRLLGCKIGKNTYINTSLLGEFDLVEIGDYASIGSGVVIQNHLFEDRIFKADRLTIGDECSIGNNTVVLYDTVMEQGSTIGPLSLLMKGETIPAHTSWHGIPTQKVDSINTRKLVTS